jgi:hypothetical protein
MGKCFKKICCSIIGSWITNSKMNMEVLLYMGFVDNSTLALDRDIKCCLINQCK